MANANDFLNDLGETITKTAKELGEKADNFFETQKLNNKVAAEQRMVEKGLADLGNVVYRKFVDGESIDEELATICEEINQHQTVIAGYREEIARLKGQKICPGCGAAIDPNSAFCFKCGTACPTPEPEEVFTGEVVDAEEETTAEEATEMTEAVTSEEQPTEEFAAKEVSQDEKAE